MKPPSHSALSRLGFEGQIVITVGTMRVRIELDGMLDIGSGFCFWPGFAAYAVDYDRPMSIKASMRKREAMSTC